MNIYKAGNSIIKDLQGKPVDYNTYVCVVEEPEDKSASEAFNEMCALLELKGEGLVKKDFETLTVKVGDGSEYTLAHETICGSNSTIKEPCGILRHVMNTVFTKDSLYIDETETIIDLTQHGVNDAINNTLQATSDRFIELVNNNPEILIELFERKYNEEYNTSNTIWVDLKKINPKRPLVNFEKLTKLVETHQQSIFNRIENNEGLRRYLIDQCGLKINVTFDASKFDYSAPKKRMLLYDDCEALIDEPPL